VAKPPRPLDRAEFLTFATTLRAGRPRFHHAHNFGLIRMSRHSYRTSFLDAEWTVWSRSDRLARSGTKPDHARRLCGMGRLPARHENQAAMSVDGAFFRQPPGNRRQAEASGLSGRQEV